MAIIDTFKIDNTPDASRIWKEMGSSFSNLSQALCEFVDDAVSNFRGNKEDESLRRIVRILVEQQKDAVDIVVEDGGTGIRNVANAMTLAGVEEQETPLNEHGYGLKHALSYVEGSGSDWEVFTRKLRLWGRATPCGHRMFSGTMSTPSRSTMIGPAPLAPPAR